MVHKKPNPEKIPGFFEPNVNFKFNKNFTFTQKSYIDNNLIAVIDDLLLETEGNDLVKLFYSTDVKEGVSIQGLKDVPSDVGSLRTTMWSEKLAKMLFSKINDTAFPNTLLTNEYSRTDSHQLVKDKLNKWKLVGVSPLLRFMEYSNGGEHYAHYDAGYFYDDNIHRTLYSFVIYLTTNETGCTRIIDDKQSNIIQSKRNNLDWSHEATNDILFKSKPIKGKCFLFPHRMCHDVEKFAPKEANEKRIIIRGDLIYKLHGH